MPIPTFDRFIDPILRYLAAHPSGASARDVHEAVAATLSVSDTDRQELLPSGIQPVYKNRAGWAFDRLKRASLATNPRRGFWQLTAAGIDFAAAHPGPSAEEVQKLAADFMDTPFQPRPTQPADREEPAPLLSPASPDERLGAAITELRATVASELRDQLARVSPSYFERIVLELLHRMGYGATQADLQQVGGSGDGGIDGIISLDKLGLEKVYVQAKRWQQTIGRPEIQAFYGALAGQRANKGVFITTSSYSPQATDFAKSVEKIVLVDGHRLADLMIEYELGVSSRTVKVPKLDSDYFDEEA